MSFKLIKKTLSCSVLLSISACSSMFEGGSTDDAGVYADDESITTKETLYQNTRNYDALISMYRSILKNEDDLLTRYKLSEAYYKKGDSSSSLLYLQPILSSGGSLAEKAKILQAKNLNMLKRYREALDVENAVLSSSPTNGEVYNLRGVTYAHLNDLNSARENFDKAREYFLNDVIAINNLAMLSIINGDYRNAISLLLPQYLNGIREQRLVHNLVFALVKNNELDYAKDIILKENLNTSPDSLIDALRKTERISDYIAK